MDITLHYMQHHRPGSDDWMHHNMLMKPIKNKRLRKNCSNQDRQMNMLSRRELCMIQEASIVRNVFIYITSLYCNFFIPTV